MRVRPACAGCATFHPQPISPEKTAAAFDARSLTNEESARFSGNQSRRRRLAAAIVGSERAHARRVLLSAGAGRGAGAMGGGAGGENHGGRTAESDRRLHARLRHQFPARQPWIVRREWDMPDRNRRQTRQTHRRRRSIFPKRRTGISLAAAWQMRSHVRAALLNLYAARETESLLARQEAAQSNVVRLLEGQLAAGAVSSYEVTQARVALDTTRLARQDATGQRRQARVQLADALGLPTARAGRREFSFAGLDQFPQRPDRAGSPPRRRF